MVRKVTQSKLGTAGVYRDWEKVYAQKFTPWDVGQPEEELVNLIKNRTIQPCKILELGCGHGNDAIFLAKNGFEVTAIDISNTAMVEARVRARRASTDITFMVRDASKPLPSRKKFQLIYDRACFHFIPEEKRKGYLANIKRLLGKGGYFLLIASSDQDSAKGPYQFSKGDIKKIFRKGFEILEIRRVTLQQHQERPTPYFCMMRRK